VSRVVVGSVELVPLVDAVGELGELAELFPDMLEWAPYRDLYPDLFVESRWRIPCTSYLLRSDGETVLVDTGVGPAGLWAWDAQFEERLIPALADAGVAPEGVDVVFLTHLHVDHVGWNTDRDGRIVFAQARYVAHRDGIAFARDSGRGHIPRTIVPIEFEAIDGETVVAEGVTAFPLPGHFPGHMGLRIDSGGERAVLMGDAAVNPMLLDRPDQTYVFDDGRAASAATRRALLPELVDQDVLVVCGHYPAGGIGHVVRRGDRVVWEATP
jgi:glyoxylase-like metal-dependent hydrolase (beta-lactamase superfamily II)